MNQSERNSIDVLTQTVLEESRINATHRGKVEQYMKSQVKVNDNVNEMYTNHLPHMTAKIDTVDTKLNLLIKIFAISATLIGGASVIQQLIFT